MTFTKERTPEMIANEVRFLRLLAPTGYVPHVLDSGEDFLTTEQIDAEPVTDADVFLVECCGLLRSLREYGVIHGDLTDRNLIVRGNRPYAIDFAESRLRDEQDRPDKRPEGDAHWLWKAYEGLTGDPRRHARRWLAIRERLAGAECRTLMDLGCNRGDLVLMAQAEGYQAAGMDYDGRSFIAPQIALGNVMSLTFTADAMLLLSVFPYLVQQRGWEWVRSWLSDLDYRRLYVECQLYGDGPGPEQFRTKADVAAFLGDFGTVTEVVSIPIPDRQTERTTFEVAR